MYEIHGSTLFSYVDKPKKPQKGDLKPNTEKAIKNINLVFNLNGLDVKKHAQKPSIGS